MNSKLLVGREAVFNRRMITVHYRFLFCCVLSKISQRSEISELKPEWIILRKNVGRKLISDVNT